MEHENCVVLVWIEVRIQSPKAVNSGVVRRLNREMERTEGKEEQI